jgi:hypothetical protein
MIQVLFVILFCLVACSPSSLEDFQREGQALSRELAMELQEIQTREELHKAAPKIKKKFDLLVDLMIEARKFQQKHPEENGFDPATTDPATSDLLLCELKRIYRLESGRETIEKAQRESLIRLDAFERSVTKQQQRLKK